MAGLTLPAPQCIYMGVVVAAVCCVFSRCASHRSTARWAFSDAREKPIPCDLSSCGLNLLWCKTGSMLSVVVTALRFWWDVQMDQTAGLADRTS